MKEMNRAHLHLVLCVTNDIVADRRVGRTAQSLMKAGHRVTVVGRAGEIDPAVCNFSYHTICLRMLFRKGPLFYASFNVRLLFYLLFSRFDVAVANDLDSLPAVFLAARIRRKVLLYDSHEYFTEVPELLDRPLIKSIWRRMEAYFLPRLKYAYTVSDSIARAYRLSYGLDMQVIRNLPLRLDLKELPVVRSIRTGEEKIILYQGSLNRGRGLELAIRAMEHVPDAKLVIIGKGDVEEELKRLVSGLSVKNRVMFTGRVSAQELPAYTVQADLGLSLERDAGLSYRYALPNKLFDYVQACVPVLVSDLPEMAALVKAYGIGIVTAADEPRELAKAMMAGLHDEAQRKIWHDNLKKAAEVLCWENEEPALLEMYRKAIKDCSPGQPAT